MAVYCEAGRLSVVSNDGAVCRVSGRAGRTTVLAQRSTAGQSDDVSVDATASLSLQATTTLSHVVESTYSRSAVPSRLVGLQVRPSHAHNSPLFSVPLALRLSFKNTSVRHSEPHPVPQCTVLPSGDYNTMILHGKA